MSGKGRVQTLPLSWKVKRLFPIDPQLKEKHFITVRKKKINGVERMVKRLLF